MKSGLRLIAAVWIAGVWIAGTAWGQSAPSRGKIERRYLATPGFQWKCDHHPAEDLCHPQGMSAALAESVERDFERILREELQFAGAARYPSRVRIFLLESPARLQALVGAYAFGSSEPSEHIVCYVLGHPESLAHELNHEVMTQLWGHSEPWIAEGLAAYFADQKGVDRDVKLLILKHQDIPLARMVRPGWTAAEYPSTVIYPELGSFVKYLKSNYGMERLRAIWQGGSGALPKLLDEPLAAVERQWRSYVMAH